MYIIHIHIHVYMHIYIYIYMCMYMPATLRRPRPPHMHTFLYSSTFFVHRSEKESGKRSIRASTQPYH